MLDRLGRCQVIGVTVTSVLVDSVNDEFSLFFIEELCLVREIDDEEKTKSSESDGDDAEEEENPPPCMQDASLGHKSKAVTNNVGETGDGHG